MSEENISTMSRSEFCDMLRSLGAAIGSGERNNVFMPALFLCANVENGDAITASYMRQVVNRVPEVKQKGVISIKRKVTDEGDGFVFTLTEAKSKPRVLTGEEIDEIAEKRAEKEVNKILNHLVNVMPNITDLEGDKLAGACEAIGRYQDMIRKLAGGKEDE